MPVGGRGGKGVGAIQSYGIRNGQSLSGINEEIVWMSIGLAITIAVLITIALCYLLHENCRKRHEHLHWQSAYRASERTASCIGRVTSVSTAPVAVRVLAVVMPVSGRVTGKSSVVTGIGGQGTANINEDIIWLTVCVGVIILVLITVALCYLLHERCQRKKAVAAGAWRKDTCPFHVYPPSDGYYIDV